MGGLKGPTSLEANSISSPAFWITLIDEQFRKKDYRNARNFILKGLASFPHFPALLDRLFIVDQRWNSPIANKRIHLVIPDESDFPFLNQCYSNEEFMGQLLPMGHKNQSPESILFSLRHNEFSVAQFRSMHRIIKKEEPVDQPLKSSESTISLKPIGLASLIDIQIAHRRAELIMGIPDSSDRQQVSIITMLLILDFAFNHIQLHKLTSLIIGNNFHSQKSTESIGFIREGLRRQHLRDPSSRLWVDCYENGLLIDDFRKNLVIARLSKRLLNRNIIVKYM